MAIRLKTNVIRFGFRAVPIFDSWGLLPQCPPGYAYVNVLLLQTAAAAGLS